MAVKTVKNLVVDQGSTFSATITVTTDGSTVKNLAGYTTTGQIRKSYASSTATDFTTSQVDATGVITISLTATQTTSLKSGRYVYDVEIANAPEVIRVREGIVTVTPQVTKS